MAFEVNRKNNQPSLFLRSGQFVRIREDEGNLIHIELMNKDTVNVFLFENADWIVETEAQVLKLMDLKFTQYSISPACTNIGNGKKSLA